MRDHADEMGFPLDRKLFEENSIYVRTALVAYNAYFSDGTDFSKKIQVSKGALQNGIWHNAQNILEVPL